MKAQYSYTALLNCKTGNLYLFFIFLITMGTSCTGQKEDNENFAGSSKRDDICQLLTKTDIQSVFALTDEIEIKQKETKNAVCSYKWRAPGEKFIGYSVSLNFARGGNRTSSQVDAIWEDQNTKLYDRHNLQNVSGVGDKASWSDLGGGQLRVASNGSIFYVSLTVSVMHGEDNSMDSQAMIDKTTALAKKIIKRL